MNIVQYFFIKTHVLYYMLVCCGPMIFNGIPTRLANRDVLQCTIMHISCILVAVCYCELDSPSK